MSDANERNTPSFEEAMQQLERIVTEMEQGDLPLADALSKFEQGIKLARASQAQLKEAEQKVQMLAQDNMTLTDFEPE
ncbi:exodeoxyribonuclease VII small subunit [Alteromonas sp. LMIT006]|jgi:exodeoxyribonuclease VII small subunit|uniref:exodeoxyribonuclease VII small subunit n=1 Tax=Alteromonadaceae TaxID=72275 RepID=UPI0020CA8D72|nr:exodeoxyribonuclease VII small subunit [Alteromonas sp. LMIT006]UTP71698.1 exodeoxyribonuclease VII small subunit [Alteromonas sp. LMIT006]